LFTSEALSATRVNNLLKAISVVLVRLVTSRRPCH